LVLHEKTLNSKKIYDGKIFRVRRDRVLLPDGSEGYREIVEHGGAVAIVPLVDEQVYFVRQYRKPVEKVLLEIPAGRLEPGESPAACARRELTEEIGFWPRRLQQLAFFYSSPGFTNEIIHLYLAQELKVKQAVKDEGEFLDVVKMPLAEALKKVACGEITDGKTMTGLLLVAGHLAAISQ